MPHPSVPSAGSCPCPSCGGRITFLDVLKIPAPFSSLQCPSCGRRLLVRHAGRLLAAGILWGCLLGWFWLGTDWPFAGKAAVVVVGLAAAEAAATAWIVKRRELRPED